VPAAVTLSQFALESAFGTRDLGGCNFFGHTFRVTELYGPPPPEKVLAFTKEFLNGEWVIVKRAFAKYATPHECFLVHGRFLSRDSHYKRAMKYTSDPVRYARELSKFYATDPQYGEKLLFIMRHYQLIGTSNG